MRSLNGILKTRRTPSPIGEWSAANSGTGETLYCVHYSNTHWCAVGANGTILYKLGTPAGNWSSATSGTGENLYHVYYNGYYWCAVGANGTILYKLGSDPSGNWSAANSGTANLLNSVHYTGADWVAVGYNGTILYKLGTDPSGNWSAANTGGVTVNIHMVGVYSSPTHLCAPRYGCSYIFYKPSLNPSSGWSTSETTTVQQTWNKVHYTGTHWVLPYGYASCRIKYKLGASPTGAWSYKDTEVVTDPKHMWSNGSYLCIVAEGGGIGYVKGTDPAGGPYNYWTAATSGTIHGLYFIVANPSYWVTVGSSGTILYNK